MRRHAEAVGTAVVAYLSALIGVQITELVAARRWLIVLVHATVVTVLIAAVHQMTIRVGAAIGRLTEQRQRLVRLAAREAERVTASTHARLTALREEPSTHTTYVPHDALAAIRDEVFGLYRSLEAVEGPVLTPGTHVNFSVTFMTRSYWDKRITVAAWANRQNRKPVSLTKRATDPDIYERSVTADLYRTSRERRPPACLIESTERAGTDYQALYPEEKEHIRSTIVYPVFDLLTELVGTLVITCDKERYFRQGDLRFWCEVLEPIAQRLALEKERLDTTVVTARDGSSATTESAPPF